MSSPLEGASVRGAGRLGPPSYAPDLAFIFSLVNLQNLCQECECGFNIIIFIQSKPGQLARSCNSCLFLTVGQLAQLEKLPPLSV